MKPSSLTLVMATLFITAAASAATITYTYSGVATGTVNGVGFTSQAYTFVATGDTTTVTNPNSDEYYNVMTGGTITIAGTACASGCTLSSPGSYYISDTTADIVRGPKLTPTTPDVAQDYLFEGCFSADCNGSGSYMHHDLASSFGPEISGAEGAITPYLTFATSGGDVHFDGLNGHITYSALVSGVQVPTLSQWGLILLSLALAVAGVFAVRNSA